MPGIIFNDDRTKLLQKMKARNLNGNPFRDIKSFLKAHEQATRADEHEKLAEKQRTAKMNAETKKTVEMQMRKSLRCTLKAMENYERALNRLPDEKIVKDSSLEFAKNTILKLGQAPRTDFCNFEHGMVAHALLTALKLYRGIEKSYPEGYDQEKVGGLEKEAAVFMEKQGEKKLWREKYAEK